MLADAEEAADADHHRLDVSALVGQQIVDRAKTFVFALVMLMASISASFAQQAGSATTHRNVPITTLGS